MVGLLTASILASAQAVGPNGSSIGCVALSMPAGDIAEATAGMRLPEEQRTQRVRDLRIKLIQSAQQCATRYNWTPQQFALAARFANVHSQFTIALDTLKHYNISSDVAYKIANSMSDADKDLIEFATTDTTNRPQRVIDQAAERIVSVLKSISSNNEVITSHLSDRVFVGTMAEAVASIITESKLVSQFNSDTTNYSR